MRAELVIACAIALLGVGCGNGGGNSHAGVAAQLYPGAEFAVGSGPSSVAVGDLNGDGHPDLVTANNASNDVSVLLGRGDGTFAAAQAFAVGVQPHSVAVGDLNGDGHLDLVTANSGSNDVSVLLGRP